MSKRPARKPHDTFSRWGEARNLAAQFSMSAEDVRDAIRMWRDVVNDVGIKPTQLAAEIKDLRKMLFGKQLIERQTGLEIMASDEAPPNTMELRQMVDVRDAWREIQLAYVLGDFKELCQSIDNHAVDCSLTDLPKRVFGLDETLGALVVRLRNAARDTSLNPNTLQLLTKYASARIDGIQLVPKDGGDKLRRVVALSSNNLKEEATAALNKARQGQAPDPKTQRIYNYALQFKYGDEKRKWSDAAHALCDDLHKRAANLDAIDRDVWEEFSILRNTDEQRGQYFSNTFHSYKRRYGNTSEILLTNPT